MSTSSLWDSPGPLYQGRYDLAILSALYIRAVCDILRVVERGTRWCGGTSAAAWIGSLQLCNQPLRMDMSQYDVSKINLVNIVHL